MFIAPAPHPHSPLHTIGILYSTLVMLVGRGRGGARGWSVPDGSCVRESVLPGFIRVCLVKGVQTRTSAAFIKITDNFAPSRINVGKPGLRGTLPRPVRLFILNARETMMRVDCRARRSAKADFNRVSRELRPILSRTSTVHRARRIIRRRDVAG